jgi:thiosulfate dehydrogenase [quinone] large subunit
MAAPRYEITDPPIAHALFADTRWAWIWVPLRLWLGWEWLQAGWHKLGDPRWMQTGEALQAFWQRAVTVPETGRPVVAYDWYRAFLQFLLDSSSHTWFAKLVTFGEILVGLGLILGAFTGIAAFFGVFMNWHFVMAGTASTNAMLAAVGVLVLMAWKTAGWWGLDRWLLLWLGTPWRPGRLAFPSPPEQRPGPQTTG